MREPIRVITWFWKQTPLRAGFDTEHVNRWAEMMRSNLTIPHTLACVTDLPDGIDPSVDIIPLSEVVPSLLMNIKGPGWSEDRGLPQCYRRLAIWMRDADQRFGGRNLVSMDLDCVTFGNLDRAFSHTDDLKLLKGTSSKRPYNGGLIQIQVGCRPQVFESITQEGIDESRKKFVGSDQAWISHVLGWGEKKFNEADGIYAWTPRFVGRNTNGRGFLIPGNTKMIFFPGVIKPWAMKISHPRMHAAWAGTAEDRLEAFKPQPTSAVRKRLWAYDDPKGWGKEFQKFAKTKGHRSWLFNSSQAVAEGEAAFVRLDQQGSQRETSRGILAKLNERKIVTLPTAIEGIWYDDKKAQLEVLRNWMPETWIENSREDAEARLEELSIAGAFPFISKAAEGAGSANVKLINNEDEAWAEIVTAFGSGIPLKYGRIQQGYIYWQRLVPGNQQDYRVVVINNMAYGLVRLNKPGTLFASGSGKNYPIALADERERVTMNLGLEIAAKIGTKWMAFDFVFDGDRPLVLEMSSAWTMKSYKDCLVYDCKLEKTGFKGSHSFELAVELLLEMASVPKEKAA